MRPPYLSLLLTCCASIAQAHDTWVQTNTNLVRTGDAVHIDLMLGNHGNDHRDYKLASKLAPDAVGLKVHPPVGSPHDLGDRLIDVGYTPKEGFWTTKYAATSHGLYVVEHTRENVVNHGKPLRSIRGAKAYYVVSASLDKVPHEHPGFDRPLGHALELVPEANPVTPMGPDVPIRVKLLFKGAPLENARISFIPRGVTLAEGFDETYERTTNANGRASFTPAEGNYHLVVAHHATDEAGADYEGTKYTATLTVFVPDVCPCCGE